ATASGLLAGEYTVTVTDENDCEAIQNFTITQPDAISITPAQENVSCNGISNGSATVAVSGGTGEYTYLWSPTGGTAATASGLLAGEYTVTVTDENDCEATQSFTITQPDAISITPSQENVSCNAETNGSATVAVSGGTGEYTYLWSPTGGTAATASGLSAGEYTVTVTDENDCEAIQS
ncbi:SprB repeat-containing protein, partial [Flavobacterium hauense]